MRLIYDIAFVTSNVLAIFLVIAGDFHCFASSISGSRKLLQAIRLLIFFTPAGIATVTGTCYNNPLLSLLAVIAAVTGEEHVPVAIW